MVNDIIVIYRKNEIILILISLKRYFSHPEKSILNLSFPELEGGIVIPVPYCVPGRIFEKKVYFDIKSAGDNKIMNYCPVYKECISAYE